MAQTTTSEASPSVTASTSYNVFSAIASSNPGSGTFGVEAGNVDSDPTNQAGQNAAGASGSSEGSMNLSTGATIAVIVVASLVVLLGASTAVLFYHAKKRQWAVRDQLRHSIRRATGRSQPKTPHTGDSTHGKPRGVIRINPPADKFRSQRNDEEKTPVLEDNRRIRDIEIGLKSQKLADQVTPALQSSFDMDSPSNVQGPGWAKVFSKK